MKKVNAKHFYSFDSATLIRAFNDEEVINAKLVDSGAKDVKTTITDTDDGFKVDIVRLMPAEAPAGLSKFVADWNEVKQSETWTGSAESGYKCDMSIVIADVPVTIKGTMEMTSSGLLTTNNVELQISCGIPLLGGKLEKFVAGNIEKSVAKEFAFLKSHLG